MIFMGIDPGLAGYCVLVNEKSRIVDSWSMPTMRDGKKNVHNVPELLRKVRTMSPKPAYIVMEKPQVMPGQGGVSNFSMGRTLGMWEALCSVLGISHQFVAPATWKKALSVPTLPAKIPSRLREVKANKKKGVKSKKLTKPEKKERGQIQRKAKNARKDAAVAVAVRMFPGFSFVTGGERATKPNDNLAEASLLAAYARRQYLGEVGHG